MTTMTLERPLRADASPREDGRIFIDSTIVTKDCGKRFGAAQDPIHIASDKPNF